MCAGAIVLSRIKDLVYAAKDPKTGAHDSVFKILNNKKLNHRIKVKKGILENEASSLMKEFFYGKRKSKT
jgi:tRNA(adenine34) deaminase